MLVGNKSDLKHLREIPEDRATSFCEEHGLNLVETSAKDNSNVEFAFQKLITEIYHEIIRKTVLDNDSGTLSLLNLSHTKAPLAPKSQKFLSQRKTFSNSGVFNELFPFWVSLT